MNQKLIDERWIQNLVLQHPELIPLEADHHSFGPLIPIGFELNTKVGRLDNLYISPSGHITVVETKLWKNTEARREVVGQILEYAAHLKGWSYDDLDAVTRKFSQKHLNREMSLFGLVAANAELEEGDEPEFVDAVSSGLANGRFLLAIVGDGIRESLEDMVDLIHGQPGVHFSLSLVELQLYETKDGHRLVVPSLVNRTVEIERAVVRIEKQAEAGVAVTGPTQEEQTPGSRKGPKRYTLGESEFFQQLAASGGEEAAKLARRLIAETTELGCVVEWKQGSFGIKYPNLATDGPDFTLLIVPKNDGVHTRSIWRQLQDAGLDKGIGLDYVRHTADLFSNLEAPAILGKPNYWSRKVPLKELFEHWDEFKQQLELVIRRINDAVESSEMDDS